jgi:PhnB protein
MANEVKPIPEGYHTITAALIVNDAAKAIDFYKSALGAEEIDVAKTPDGSKVVHSVLKVGDSFIFVSDEFPEMGARSPQSFGGSPISLYLYVDDVDAWFKRAVDAGAAPTMPVSDMFWGDRFGSVKDPYGHSWSFSTHIKDLTPEEMAEASNDFFSKMANEAAQKAG